MAAISNEERQELRQAVAREKAARIAEEDATRRAAPSARMVHWVRRQFVIRLWQSHDPEFPALYDKLLTESLRRSALEGRSVPMTEIVREALEEKFA